MDTSANQPHFVTCRCQICDGHIEFDSNELPDGQAQTVECPLCHAETLLQVPASSVPSAALPPLPLDPILSNGQIPTLEIRLTSGAPVTVVAVQLYDEKCIEELKSNFADAKQWLEESAHAGSLEAKKELMKLSSRGISLQQKVRPWDVAPTAASAIIGVLEPFTAKTSFENGIKLLNKVRADERNLINRGRFFHISRVENANQPEPSYWRALFNPATFVHDGSDFVAVQNEKGLRLTLRWSAIESYAYQKEAGPS